MAIRLKKKKADNTQIRILLVLAVFLCISFQGKYLMHTMREADHDAIQMEMMMNQVPPTIDTSSQTPALSRIETTTTPPPKTIDTKRTPDLSSAPQLVLPSSSSISAPVYYDENGFGKIDWSKIDHVYYYHTRKAAGTTLVRWVRGVAWSKNKTFDHDEGFTFDHEGTGFWQQMRNGNKDAVHNNKRTLYVTGVRPPEDRTLSSFTYDHNGQGGFMRYYTNTQEFNYVVKPTKKDFKKTKKVRGWTWACASECYSKWFGGWPLQNGIINATTTTMTAQQRRYPSANDDCYYSPPNSQVALETLEHFELIFMMNLNHAPYQDWLKKRFDAYNVRDTLHNKRKTQTGTNQKRKKANLTQPEKEFLRQVNSQDVQIYNHLQKKWNAIVNLDNYTLV